MGAVLAELLSKDFDNNILKTRSPQKTLNSNDKNRIFQIKQEPKEFKKTDSDNKFKSENNELDKEKLNLKNKKSTEDDPLEKDENIDFLPSLINPLLNDLYQNLEEQVSEEFIPNQEDFSHEFLESEEHNYDNIFIKEDSNLEIGSVLNSSSSTALAKDLDQNSLSSLSAQNLDELTQGDNPNSQNFTSDNQSKVIIEKPLIENIVNKDSKEKNYIQSDESNHSFNKVNIETVKGSNKNIVNQQLVIKNQPLQNENVNDKQIALSSTQNSNTILAGLGMDTKMVEKADNKADLNLLDVDGETIIDPITDNLEFENFDNQNKENTKFGQNDAYDIDFTENEVKQLFNIKNNTLSSNSSVNSYPKPETQVSNIVMELANNAKTGQSEVVVNLFPEELGSITVKIISVMGEDNVKKIQTIKIISQNQQTAEILETNRKDLDKILKTITAVNEDTKLEFEMGRQNQEQNNSYFDNNDDRNNWMKNFIKNEYELGEDEEEMTVTNSNIQNSNPGTEENSQANLNIMV